MESSRFSRHNGTDVTPGGYYSSYRNFRTDGYLNLEERIFLFCELLRKNQVQFECDDTIEPENPDTKNRKKKAEPGGSAGDGPHLSVQ